MGFKKMKLPDIGFNSVFVRIGWLLIDIGSSNNFGTNIAQANWANKVGFALF